MSGEDPEDPEHRVASAETQEAVLEQRTPGLPPQEAVLEQRTPGRPLQREVGMHGQGASAEAQDVKEQFMMYNDKRYSKFN